MNTLTKALSVGLLMAATTGAQAYEAIFTTGTNEQQCYAKSMIGFDSVINSRVGVLPEHALDLAVKNNAKVSADGQKEYSSEILKTVLDAYLWENSPHSYAVKIFYACAAERGDLRSAQNQTNIFE